MRRMMLGLAVAGAAAIGLSAYTLAQSGLAIQPDVEAGVYQVRVVNDMGYPVRVKILGHRFDAHFVADLNVGDETTQNFYGGDRVVCVWDQAHRLQLVASVPFRQPGTLPLRQVTYTYQSEGAARSSSCAADALPTMAVEGN